MEQVQIFNNDLGLIQESINNWLKEKGDTITITKIKQSTNRQYNAYLIISIFYIYTIR